MELFDVRDGQITVLRSILIRERQRATLQPAYKDGLEVVYDLLHGQIVGHLADENLPPQVALLVGQPVLIALANGPALVGVDPHCETILAPVAHLAEPGQAALLDEGVGDATRRNYRLVFERRRREEGHGIPSREHLLEVAAQAGLREPAEPRFEYYCPTSHQRYAVATVLAVGVWELVRREQIDFRDILSQTGVRRGRLGRNEALGWGVYPADPGEADFVSVEPPPLRQGETLLRISPDQRHWEFCR